ncbi:MAG: response regulator [Bacteroidetes bacterium]|nr:MAG: response regulator [Bacteroidota bacterium]
MNEPRDLDMIREISLLYELSLSIGSSTDLQENCAHFLSTLCLQKKLTYAAVWLRAEYTHPTEADGKACRLVCGMPERRIRETRLPGSHSIVQRLGEEQMVVASCGDEYFEELVWEKNIQEGTYYIFRLENYGFLKLYLINTPQEAPERKFRKMRNVIRQFTASVASCLSYQRLEAEIVRRREIESQLKRALAAEEQFYARISHEIWTPLNGMMGMLTVLKHTALDADQQSYVSDTLLACNSLVGLLNDTLDFARINEGRIDIERVKFNLHETLRTLYQNYKLHAAEKKLRMMCAIDVELPPEVQGDSLRLSQIVGNLLSNAVKYTEKGEVRMDVHCTYSNEDRIGLQIVVSDTGLGIPPESLPHIFEAFEYSSQDLSSKTGASGLGLAIVGRLVDLMGGRIAVESEVGTGTTFTVDLPMFKSHAPIREKTDAPSGVQRLEGVRVLLVEDTPMNQKVAQRLLEMWGAIVEVANHGKEAIQICQRQVFDVILMDIQMPLMDGYEATRIIRSQSGSPNQQTPIIAFTASVRAQVTEVAFAAGMNAYILKPFNAEQLYAVIRSLLNIPEEKPRVQEALTAGGPTGSESHTAGLDISYLRELAEGDDAFVREMLAIFVQNTPSDIDMLARSVASFDWPAIRHGSHKLKYPLASVGREDMVDILREMESMASESPDPERLLLLFERLKQETQTSVAQAQSYISPS